jgi:multicomponent Na+:H+ antiporter subunit G
VTVRDAIAWLGDGLVLLGCLVMTIGVVGVIRMPDVYAKLHAASKSVFLGVCSILVAAIAQGEAAIGARAVLIFGLLLLTTPVAAYEMARAAAREGERALTPLPPSPIAMGEGERGGDRGFHRVHQDSQ